MNKTIELDFTGITSFAARIPAGTHVVSIKKAEVKNSSTGSPMLTVTYENTNGEIAYDNFVLVSSALWKLKIFLEAVFAMPFDSKTTLNPDKLVNRKVIITVEDEEYMNPDGEIKIRSNVLTEYKPVNTTASAPVSAVLPTPPAAPFVAPVANTPTPASTPAPVAPTPAPAPEIPVTSTPQVPTRPKLPWE